ncbi:MAG: hypothetical protein LV479_07295 [Methylacidiphilales bacterium]|nr:hypothetical protein [Candidatus Methylacidiphilales bacterium]
MKAITTLVLLAVVALVGSSHADAAVIAANHVTLAMPHHHPLVSSVPEPSDWAWIPVLGTIAVVAWRRFGRKVSA